MEAYDVLHSINNGMLWYSQLAHWLVLKVKCFALVPSRALWLLLCKINSHCKHCWRKYLHNWILEKFKTNLNSSVKVVTPMSSPLEAWELSLYGNIKYPWIKEVTLPNSQPVPLKWGNMCTCTADTLELSGKFLNIQKSWGIFLLESYYKSLGAIKKWGDYIGFSVEMCLYMCLW